ncbi:MAG: response regulator [Zoogloeaceae bacterium]|nr:response regulator [Rhodocyclaceae bacterium]MCP5236921.1 response regulator [Zoogloeaceae bacterium]
MRGPAKGPSFRWKAIVGIAAIEAVALTVTIGSALGQMELAQQRQLRQSADTALALFSAAIADAVVSYDLAKIAVVAEGLVERRQAAYVRVRDADRRELLAIGDALALAGVFDPANPPLDEDGIFDVGGAVRAGDAEVGTIELGIDNRSARAELDHARRLAAVAATIGMGLAALFSWLLGGWLATGIARLAGSAEAIASGELSARAPGGGEREVASLAGSFNRMAAALEQRDAERNDLLRRAEQAAEHASIANRAKSMFLAAISHDIRTPLNGIWGIAQLLSERPDREDAGELGRMLRDSTAHLRRLVDDVLDFSRIESGRIDLDQAPFDPSRVLSACVSGFERDAGDKGLRIGMTGQLALPPRLLGDSTRLAQIVTNLLSNAIKFTASGEIAVEARARLDDSRAKARWWLEIVVNDSGPGLPPDRIDDLFEPFCQEDASITRRFGGSGLGLAICRRLAEAMGGRISALNRSGGGASFKLEVPFELVPADVPLPADDAPPADAASIAAMRVLLVEDNPINRRVAASLLRPHVGRVDTAEDGAEALEMAAPGRYDVILMDLQMPRLDGRRASIAIMNRLAGSAPPIVALTAHALIEEREQCLALGMRGYLTKPFDLGEVLRQLEVIAGGAGDASGQTAKHLAGDARRGAPAPVGELDPAPAIRRCGDDAACYRELLEIELPRLAALAAGPAISIEHGVAGARIEVRERVHALKGACMTLGLGRIAQTLGRIEIELGDDALDAGRINAALADVGARLGRAVAEIECYLAAEALRRVC